MSNDSGAKPSVWECEFAGGNEDRDGAKDPSLIVSDSGCSGVDALVSVQDVVLPSSDWIGATAAALMKRARPLRSLS